MRYLAARNPKQSIPITLIPMRGKTDCLTCVIAMLLGLKYEEVEQTFGGSLDPTKVPDEEAARLQRACYVLCEKYKRGLLHLSFVPHITEGRRYWVAVQINDPSNSFPQSLSHSIVVDEFGRVFDPNPQYGKLKSLKDWQVAMTLPHQLHHATEVFEYSVDVKS